MLRRVNELSNELPLKIIPFLSPLEMEGLWHESHMYKFVAGGGRIVAYITSLLMDQELETEPAVITDIPYPECELSPSWLKVLAAIGNSDDPPAWRFPMLFIPRVRRKHWPNMEINFRHSSNADTRRRRNIVTAEQHQEHRYFIPDIDPWRLGCVGEPRPEAPVNERKATCRRLPRPPLLPLNLPLSQLAEAARGIHDCTCGRGTHYYYLPPLSWQPTNRGRDDWRNNAFERDGVVFKGGEREKETGWRDRNGHIWVWDESEHHQNHWDVKTPNDTRLHKVRYDGFRLAS